MPVYIAMLYVKNKLEIMVTYSNFFIYIYIFTIKNLGMMEKYRLEGSSGDHLYKFLLKAGHWTWLSRALSRQVLNVFIKGDSTFSLRNLFQ